MSGLETAGLVMAATSAFISILRAARNIQSPASRYHDALQSLYDAHAILNDIDRASLRDGSAISPEQQKLFKDMLNKFNERLGGLTPTERNGSKASRLSRRLSLKAKEREAALALDLETINREISIYVTMLKAIRTTTVQTIATDTLSPLPSEPIPESRPEMRPISRLFEARAWIIPYCFEASDCQKARHRWYSESRLGNTCTWFTKSREFEEWHKSDKAEFLWVQGAAGVGKSTLMSHVVELLRVGSQEHQRYPCVYYYMVSGRVQWYEDFSTNVEHQLALSRKEKPSMDQDVVVGAHIYESDSQMSLGDGSKAHKDLQATILIDSWDEENMSDMTAFENFLQIHVRLGHSLLIFSRGSPPQILGDRKWKHLELTLERNKCDIITFTDALIANNLTLQGWIHGSDVKDRLIAMTAGSFFLCKLLVERVLAQQTRQELSDLVRGLRYEIAAARDLGTPTPLVDQSIGTDRGTQHEYLGPDTACGDDINWALEALLREQSSGSATIARRTLTWLALTAMYQPMSMLGLCESLAITNLLEKCPADQPPLRDINTHDILTPEAVLSCCKGFVWVDPGTTDVVLADETLGDQVLAVWSDERMTECVNLGTACLQYLCFDAFKSGPCETLPDLRQRLETFNFMRFASRNWLYLYVRSQLPIADAQSKGHQVDERADGRTTRMRSLALILLKSKSRQHLLSASQTAFYEDYRNKAPFEEVFPRKIRGMSTLQLVASLGLNTLISSMLDTSSEHSLVPRVPWTFVEDLAGSRKLFKTLILCLFNTTDLESLYAEHTVLENVDPKVAALRSRVCTVLGKDFISALIFSDEDLLRPNATGVIKAAASNGMFGMVAKLLQWVEHHHASLYNNRSHWTAMAWMACKQQDPETLSMILDRKLLDFKGAMTGRRHDSHQEYLSPESPLQVACQLGNYVLAEKLVNYGVDLNSPIGSQSSSPLLEAVNRGHKEIVALLLGAGAVIDYSQAETPLHIACRRGNDQIVEILLHYGANPRSRGIAGCTPLMEAVHHASETIVLILLNAGATFAPKENPLHVAVGKASKLGNAELRVLQILLASVADVHMKDADGYEATQIQGVKQPQKILDLFERFDYTQASTH